MVNITSVSGEFDVALCDDSVSVLDGNNDSDQRDLDEDRTDVGSNTAPLDNNVVLCFCCYYHTVHASH